MSSLKMFCIKDLKAGYFLNPFFMRTPVEALRAFEQVANDTGNAISNYPHDHRLYEIANFDVERGVVSPHADHVDLGSAADVKRKPEGQLPMFPSGPKVPAVAG